MYHYTQTNSFPIFFSMPNGHIRTYDESDDQIYSYSPPPSVDCTLSLGTSSTPNDKKRLSNFSWNILPSKQTQPPLSNPNCGSDDPLLARRCTNCDTTSTPLWRNGPRGPKSLCNACGIRYKKEQRRAAAATSHGETQHVINNSGGYLFMKDEPTVQYLDPNHLVAVQCCTRLIKLKK